jgi:antitoxin component YwqK of YwqJK toxin-antitoxin module
VATVILITNVYLPVMTDVAVSPNEYEPWLAPFLKFELLVILGFLIVEMTALVFFYKKHRLFPKIYIGLRLADIVWVLLASGAYRLVVPDEPVLDSDTIGKLIQSSVAAAVWIPYMFHSKRVANTFVNPVMSPARKVPWIWISWIAFIALMLAVLCFLTLAVSCREESKEANGTLEAQAVTLTYPDGMRKGEGQMNEAGKKDGSWTYWHENGQKAKEGEYEDGEPEGRWMYWFENGKKQHDGQYKDGIKVGEWYSAGNDGEFSWYAVFLEGQLAEWTVERRDLGQGRVADSRGFTSEAGTKEGEWNSWYENNQKESKGFYWNGVREDVWTYWHENGQKAKEREYKEGKKEGLWTYWHENGQKQSEREYKDGKEEGLWTYWHENGQKQSEREYKDGELIRATDF